MSLSDSRIYDIFYNEIVKNYSIEQTIIKIEYFFSSFLVSFFAKINIPSIFKNWNKIESSVPLLLIFLANEHKEGKKTCFGLSLIPEKIEKTLMETIYALILSEYKTCCENSGLNFVPNLKGLETILRKKSRQ